MIYFEEVMLQGIILGYIRLDFDEIVEYIDKYVKKIDNWFMCDNFCKRKGGGITYKNNYFHPMNLK